MSVSETTIALQILQSQHFKKNIGQNTIKKNKITEFLID